MYGSYSFGCAWSGIASVRRLSRMGAGSRTHQARRLVPTWAMVHLTHAAVQAVADEVGVDILHIKGPTDSTLRSGAHDSTDADVLVRPAQVEALIRALEARGWTLHGGFEEGSPFGHAAVFQHPAWAWLDVHRAIPGARRDADDVFERLWENREIVEIAHWGCAAPSSAARVLIQVMHVARSHGIDIPETWRNSPDDLRSAVRALAADLDARVAFAAGIGELELHRGDRTYALWKYWSGPDDNRLREWLARLRAENGLRARVRVAAQALRVNRTRLRMRLGREPTRLERAAEQLARMGRAAGSIPAAMAARMRTRRGTR